MTRYIRQANNHAYVINPDGTMPSEPLEQYPSIVNNPEVFVIEEGEPLEGASRLIYSEPEPVDILATFTPEQLAALRAMLG